jgi:hypothetical protein
MMKFLPIYFCLFFCPFFSGASSQLGDRLINGNDTFELWTQPLESEPGFMQLRKTLGEPPFCLSSCSRGYIAQWTICEKGLYMTGIRSCCIAGDTITSTFRKMHPEIETGKGLKASWFTGALHIPDGKLLKFISNHGYDALYEKHIFLDFENGIYLKSDTLDNTGSQMLALSADPKKLEEFIYSCIEWKYLQDFKPRTDSYIQLVFFWGELGKYQGMAMGEADSVIAKSLSKSMKALSADFPKSAWHNYYVWIEWVTLERKRLKKLIKLNKTN